MKQKSLFSSNKGYIKISRWNVQFLSCWSTPAHKALSSFHPLNHNFYHFGSITCSNAKTQTLPRLFSTPRSREFPLASRPNASWAQPFSNALHTLEVIQCPPDSQRFSIGFTEFWIRVLKKFSCFFSPHNLAEVRTTLPAVLQEAAGERLDNQTTQPNPGESKETPICGLLCQVIAYNLLFFRKGLSISQKFLSSI